MSDLFKELLRSGNDEDFAARLDAHSEEIDVRETSGATLAQLACNHGRSAWAGEIQKRAGLTDWGTACALGDVDRVAKNLDLGTHAVNELSADGWLPICLASAFGHAQLVDLLLDAGASLTAQSQEAGQVRALDAAIFGRNQAIIHRLLEPGANPNLAQDGGFTPLHGACQNGSLEV